MAVFRRPLLTGRARAPALGALYVVGAAAPRFAAFLLLPIYAFELSPAQLAAYGIAVSLAQVIGLLADVGTLDGLGITYFEQPDDQKAAYFKTVAVFSRLTSLVVMAPIGLLLYMFWAPLFGDGLERHPGLWLILVFAFLQRGNTLAGGMHRLRDHHGRFAATKLVPAVVQTIAGLTYVFVLGWGSLGAIAAAPTGFLISILVANIGPRSSRAAYSRLPVATVRRIVALGVPTLPESLAKWAQMLALRPLLQLTSTVLETARFTFSGAFGQVVSPITEAFEQYISPKYYRGAITGDDGQVRRARDLTSLFGGVAAVGALVGIVAMDPAFRAFAPPSYADTGGLAAIGLAGILLRGPMSLMVDNLRVCDHRAMMVLTVFVGVTASICQFFLLVDKIGAYSAAAAVYVYPFVSCLMMLWILRDGKHRLVDVRDLLVTQATVLIVLAVAIVLPHVTNGPVATLLLGGVAATVGTVVIATTVGLRHREAVQSFTRRPTRSQEDL